MKYLQTYVRFSGFGDAWDIIFGDKLDEYIDILNLDLINIQMKKFGTGLLSITITNEYRELQEKYDKIFEEIYERIKDIPKVELIKLKNFKNRYRLLINITFDSYEFQKYIIENYPERVTELFDLSLVGTNKIKPNTLIKKEYNYLFDSEELGLL